MDIEVRRIDPADEVEVRAWWEALHAAHAERPLNPVRPFELSLAILRDPSVDDRAEAYAAYDADAVVGAASLYLPLRDNTHLAFGDVCVPPEHRGRGVGSALLAAWEEAARAAARRTFLHGVTAAGDGTRIATTHGYVEVNREETKAVSLGEAMPSWVALDGEVAARLDGYCVETWRSFAPDGTPCATSGVNVVGADPSRAFIGLTMVLPGHRGHALGLGMKLATHRALHAAYPQCERIITSNANVNEHMNAINERMGYRVLEQVIEMQKKL